MSDMHSDNCPICRGAERESALQRQEASSFAAPTGSVIRPHEEQTPLERVIRSHLWGPNDILARGEKELPKCVKAKEYQEAANWQKLMQKAESEIKDWEYLLELYEQERKSPND